MRRCNSSHAIQARKPRRRIRPGSSATSEAVTVTVHEGHLPGEVVPVDVITMSDAAAS
jgi:hypothetical protein